MVIESGTEDGVYALHIWRDEVKVGLEVKVNGSRNRLDELQKRIGDWKFYPLIKKLDSMNSFSLSYRENSEKAWQKGLPNLVNKPQETPEFMGYKPKIDSKVDKKSAPAWMELIDGNTLSLKRRQDEIDKQNDTAFQPYSNEVYEGFAKAYVLFHKNKPDYKEPSWEKSKYGFSTSLIKGAIWGWKKKLDNLLQKDPQEYSVKIGAWQGKMATFKKVGRDALQAASLKYGLSDNLSQRLISAEDNIEEEGEDEYLTSQATETNNNKRFLSLDKETQEAIMKATGLSQKDINKRLSAIGSSERNPDVLSFGEILKRGK